MADPFVQGLYAGRKANFRDPLVDALNTPLPEQALPTQGALPAGFSSGLRGSKAMTEAYAASALEAAGQEEAARRWYADADLHAQEAAQLAPEIQDFEQVQDVPTGLRFAAGALGQGVASTLPALGLTLATRGLGGGKALSFGAGAAGMLPQEAGESVMTMRRDPAAMANTTPGERFAVATGKGAINAVGEEVVPFMIGNRLMTRAGAKTLGQAAKGVAKDVVKASAGEGATEAGQELVGQQAHALANPARDTGRDTHDIINAGLTGAVAGGGMSMPTSVVAGGLDLAASGGRQAADATKGAASTLHETLRGSGGILLDPQTPPGEILARGREAVGTWLAENDAARQAEAATVAGEILNDPASSPTERADAQAFVDNADRPQAWKYTAAAVQSRKAAAAVRGKINDLYERLSTVKDTTGNRQSQTKTADDLAIQSAMEDYLRSRYYDALSQAEIDRMYAGMKLYAKSNYGRDSEALDFVPGELQQIFGDRTENVLTVMHDLMRRAGMTEATPEDLARALAGVKQHVAGKKSLDKVVDENLTLQSKLAHGKKVGEITALVRSYLSSGKKNEAVEADLDELFGKNKDAVLRAFDAQDRPGRVRSKDLGTESSDARGAGEEDSGSDAVEKDYESALQEEDAPATEYVGRSKEKPTFFSFHYHDENRLTSEKAAYERARARAVGGKGAVTEVSPAQYMKETGKSALDVARMMPELRNTENATEEQLREAIERSTARMLRVDSRGGDDAIELTGADIKGLTRTQTSMRTERLAQLGETATHVSKKLGGRAVSELHDRGVDGIFYVRPAEHLAGEREDGSRPVIKAPKRGAPDADGVVGDKHERIAIDAMALVKLMREKKKLGAFDERTAKTTGPRDMLNMFAAGLTSLIDSQHIYTEDGFIGVVKAASGKERLIKATKDVAGAFGKDFVLFNTGSEKITVGDAVDVALPDAEARQAERDKDAFQQYVVQDLPGKSRAETTVDIEGTVTTELRGDAENTSSLKPVEPEEPVTRLRAEMGERKGFDEIGNVLHPQGKLKGPAPAPAPAQPDKPLLQKDAETVKPLTAEEAPGRVAALKRLRDAQDERDKKNVSEPVGDDLQDLYDAQDKWDQKNALQVLYTPERLRDAQDEGDKETMKVVLPRTSPYTAKDQAKSDKATKFIGRGSAASSTAAYAKAWGARANSGAYEATDTVFVSVEGARTGRKVLDTEELQRALDAGATIITDDAANRGRSYNVGERTLAAYLKYHAYEEAAPGEWKPVDAQDKNDKQALYSQQKAGIDEMSPEQQTEVRTYVEKTLGPKVHVLFEKLGVSGEWTREDGEAYIRIALTALNPLSVAHHEAMHEFFQRLVDGADARTQKILLDAANSALVRRQLERKLSEAGEDAAVKQLDDPAERLAYMYQFWAAGELTVGPKTETLFQRAMNFLRNVVGVLSQSQKAELLLDAFHTGKLAEPSAVAKLLDTVEAAENRYKEAAKVFKPVADLALRGAGTAYYTLERSGNPHLKKLASLFDTVVGEKTGEQSFFSARSQQTGVWLNRLENILQAEGVTKEDVALAEKHLQENTVPKDAVARKLHNEIRKLLDDAHVYLRDAGVKVLVDGEPDERGKPTKEWKPLGFKENYYPHVWSVDTLMELGQGDEFKQDLLKHHMKEMRTIAELATRDDPKNPVTPEDVAKGIVQRLLASQGVRDLQESSSELGFSPYMKAVNRRSLDFLDMEVFSKYLEKDMVNTLTSYLGQGVKRAEYSRKFKADGSVIKELMEKAETYEIEQLMKQHPKTPREKLVAQARAGMTGAAKAVMAMEGTLGYDINPQLRRFTGWVMMMQNYALLTMQIFSSQVDPVGIVVRGGTIKDAFDAYRRGVQEIVASIKNQKSTDDAARLAELLGTVDAGTYMDALGQTYSSVFMYGKAKHFSDKLFRYNGAEGWNRGMRIVATQAAISFIERHASKPDTHSKRWLEELYGDGAPVLKGGKLDTDAAANRLAIMRWVDGAILRPNAAHRPAWASDPHYALAFQLKQFTYSFQRTILARVHNELKHGNLSPLMSIAVGYMPVMLAADLAKALLKGVLGDEPAWVHGSLLDITSHTAQRAGLLGVGQFGVDAVKWGPAELAGPTAERMVQLIQAGAASEASP